MVASVARNGDTCRLVTRKPLSRPAAIATTIAIATMDATSRSAPENPVAITAAVAIIEATYRSRPRTIITMHCPMATMASGANCSSRLERLPGLRKAGDITPPSRSSSGSARAMPKRVTTVRADQDGATGLAISTEPDILRSLHPAAFDIDGDGQDDD